MPPLRGCAPRTRRSTAEQILDRQRQLESLPIEQVRHSLTCSTGKPDLLLLRRLGGLRQAAGVRLVELAVLGRNRNVPVADRLDPPGRPRAAALAAGLVPQTQALEGLFELQPLG